MMHNINLQPTAQSDVDRIISYLAERSPQGAWCKAWDNLLSELRAWPESFGIAPESRYYEDEIRQALFKTRRGRTYRVLFEIVDDTVHVIHVRGPGQELVPPGDLQLL